MAATNACPAKWANSPTAARKLTMGVMSFVATSCQLVSLALPHLRTTVPWAEPSQAGSLRLRDGLLPRQQRHHHQHDEAERNGHQPRLAERHRRLLGLQPVHVLERVPTEQ